jgi:hypothetical protein
MKKCKRIVKAKFNLLDEAHYKTCFDYTNLQPLWA